MELACVETIPDMVHHHIQFVDEACLIVVHIDWRNVSLLLICVERLKL